MQLARARSIAEEFASMIEPATSRLTIAGSIRRLKNDVKDAEIVIVPTLELYSLLDRWVEDGTIFKALYGEGERATYRWGAKYRGLVYRGLRIEIFCAEPGNYGYILWLRTGPADCNQWVMSSMVKSKIRAIDGWLWYAESWRKDGDRWTADRMERLATPDEDDVWAVYCLTPIRPQFRDIEEYQIEQLNLFYRDEPALERRDGTVIDTPAQLSLF